MNYKVRRILQASCFAGALTLAAVSQSASINGYAVGNFHSVVDKNGSLIMAGTGSSLFSTINNDSGATSRVQWGQPQNNGSDGLPNYFVFNGNASDTYQVGVYGSTAVNNLFSLGSFDYHNGKTRQDDIVQVNFRVDMGIDGFMQATTGTLGSAYLDFTMSINNTNDNNDPVASADSVWVSGVNVGMDTPGGHVVMAYDFMNGMDMLIGGNYYNFMLMGFSRDGGNTFESQAVSQENTTTSANIYAMITPLNISPVPVPAAIWLMGSGFAGLMAFGYRRKK